MKKAFGVLVMSAMAVGGVAVAASPLVAPVSAPVARVASEGVVYVNRGEGFVPAGSAAMVSAGDQLRSASPSQLVYGDGCSVQVAALDAFSVAATSPCFKSTILTNASYVQAQTAGQAATVPGQAAGAGAGAGSTAGASSFSVMGMGAAASIATVAVATVAVVAVVDEVANDDDDEPISR